MGVDTKWLAKQQEARMSDALVKRGYADGKYVCSCRKCEGTFMGDKRAWCCKGCAVSADRIEELEAKLAKALLIIEAYGDDEGYIPKRVVHLWNELTGGKDET